MIIYTPAYISSIIFIIILLLILAYFIYNIVYYILEYAYANKKYRVIFDDNYTLDDPYNIDNIDNYNTKLINEFDNKDNIIFEKNENKRLRDLLAFKYNHDASKIDNINNQINIGNIDNPTEKALSTIKSKVNISSLDPNYDEYSADEVKKDEYGLSVIKNITNPSYYLVNPLDKIDNKEILTVNVDDDINLNQIIYNKVNQAVQEKLDALKKTEIMEEP